MQWGLKLSLVLIDWGWRTHFEGGCLAWLPEGIWVCKGMQAAFP